MTVNKQGDAGSWEEFSREHPWLLAMIGGIALGAVAGFIIAQEEDAIIAAVAGAMLAIVAFVPLGLWGLIRTRGSMTRSQDNRPIDQLSPKGTVVRSRFSSSLRRTIIRNPLRSGISFGAVLFGSVLVSQILAGLDFPAALFVAAGVGGVGTVLVWARGWVLRSSEHTEGQPRRT